MPAHGSIDGFIVAGIQRAEVNDFQLAGQVFFGGQGPVNTHSVCDYS
jgi:hypothetical protein